MGDPVSNALIPAGIQLISSSMAGDSARDAAQTSANAQLKHQEWRQRRLVSDQLG